MLLRDGEIDIVVTNQVSQEVKRTEETELNFDVLNQGSCFCAYSFICDDAQQLQKFVAKTICIVESISREDFFQIAKKYYQLADKLDFIRQKFEEDETDFDFFRYRIANRNFSDKLKSLIRKKFRVALTRFIRKYKKGETDIPPALRILKEFQQDRSDKQMEINRLRNAYAMSLLIGEGETESAPAGECCAHGRKEKAANQDGEGSQDKEPKEETEGDGEGVQDRMKALQNFASISTRVPDAKYSKARQRKILKRLQEDLKDENQALDAQIAQV